MRPNTAPECLLCGKDHEFKQPKPYYFHSVISIMKNTYNSERQVWFWLPFSFNRINFGGDYSKHVRENTIEEWNRSLFGR